MWIVAEQPGMVGDWIFTALCRQELDALILKDMIETGGRAMVWPPEVPADGRQQS